MIKVSKGDLFWNYGATFMRVASALIVLPIILRMLPKQEVGLWSIMIGLNSIIYLLDFGFFQTFSRAITYTYSGAKALVKEGFLPIEEGAVIEYSLLKSLLGAMKHYYAFVALLLAILFSSAGVWYINRLLIDFSGNLLEAKLAWYLYGVLLCFQFYTYYYDAILVGRGMIKRSRQIIVLSQSIHIILSSILLLSGAGIISMVIGQGAATVLNRSLAKRAFYDTHTKNMLSKEKSSKPIEILKTLFYTASRNGLASLSWIFTNRMLALFGALYIPLSSMASYGISKQITDITITISAAWFFTYYPKLTSEQIKKATLEVKRIFVKAQIITVIVFIFIAAFTLLFAQKVLNFIGSSTDLLENKLLILLFIASLLEALTQLSTSLLMSKNEVPHYLAQSITAIFATIALFVSLSFFNSGVLALIAVPMIAQLAYQHWKWSYVALSSLNVSWSDYLDGFKALHKSIPIFNNNKGHK